MRNSRFVVTLLAGVVLFISLSIPVTAQSNQTEILRGRLSQQTSGRMANGKLFSNWNRHMLSGIKYHISVESDSFDTFLQIQDAFGNVLQSDDDGGVGLNSQLTFQPSTTGTYRIVVTSYSSGETGNYTLRIEPEARNTAAFGFLSTSAPRDAAGKYYRMHAVHVSAPGWITLDLKSQDFDTYMRLFDLNGNLIDWNDDSGAGTNSRIRFYANRAGEFQALVTSYHPGETGNYTLMLHR